MAKKRRYGEAWKDVQIDAEQNDAVFDRFFKITKHEPPATPEHVEEALPEGKGIDLTPPPVKSLPAPQTPPAKRSQSKASISPIIPKLANIAPDTDAAPRINALKQQYRLSKGEASVLRILLDKASESGATECHAKIPELADACDMTHRGCQYALKNLETRGFIVRLKEYDPSDRLGVQFRLTLPA